MEAVSEKGGAIEGLLEAQVKCQTEWAAKDQGEKKNSNAMRHATGVGRSRPNGVFGGPPSL